MPAIKDWRGIVTDDVTLVFDLDTPCYNAAASEDKKYLSIRHKDTGEEFFEYKDKPVIKNVKVDDESGGFHFTKVDTGTTENIPYTAITKFWGRKKKVIEGPLGNINLEREMRGEQPYAKEDFIVEEKVVSGDVSFAVSNLKRKIATIKEYLGVDRAIYILGEGDNHRHKLHLPAGTTDPLSGQYKGNRKDTTRPTYLKQVREYAVNVLGAKMCPAGFEADEIVSTYGRKSHEHYKKTGKHKYILITIDKDAMGFNGLIFNPFIQPGESVWKHPYPYLVDGLGSVYLNAEGKVKGEGFKWLMGQILLGDSSDGYSPTARLGVTGGDTKAYLLLAPTNTYKEAVEAVCKQYKEWFPEGVNFTSWDGSEQHLTWLEWADIIFRCAYMLNGRNDKTSFIGLVEKLGVEI